MADNQQQENEQPLYPRPPPFWQAFTATNVEEYKQLQEQAEVTKSTPPSDVAKAVSIPTSNAALECLVPPPEPEDGMVYAFAWRRYKVPIIPSFDPSIPFMHPEPPSPADLVRLTRTNLLAILEFFHVMSVNPSHEAHYERSRDIIGVQVNIIRALNMYRHWAAREDLIKLMEHWAQRARDEVSEVGRLEQAMKELVDGIRNDADVVDRVAGRKTELDGANSGQNGINGSQDDHSKPATEASTMWESIMSVDIED